MMNLNADIGELPWKKIVLVLFLTAGVAGLAWGGWSHFRRAPGSMTPEQSKTAIASYLHKKTGRSDFRTTFDVSKEKNPWDLLKVSYDAPPDYKSVYRSIGEHLYIADKMIGSAEARQQLMGIYIAIGLAEIAHEVAYDPWLAARICDAYVIPHIDKVEETPKSWLGSDRLMRAAARAYREAEEDERLIEVGKMYLAKYGSTSKAVDVRRRLVSLLQSKGRQKEAQIVQELGKNAPQPKPPAPPQKTTTQTVRTNGTDRQRQRGTNVVKAGTNNVQRQRSTNSVQRATNNVAKERRRETNALQRTSQSTNSAAGRQLGETNRVKAQP